LLYRVYAPFALIDEQPSAGSNAAIGEAADVGGLAIGGRDRGKRPNPVNCRSEIPHCGELLPRSSPIRYAAFLLGGSECNLVDLKFIKLLGGAAVAWPCVARGQQAGRMRRVGVLMGYAEGDVETKLRLAAFQQGLERLGWSEGSNVRIDCRSSPAATTDQAQVLARELVTLQPDVILAQ
jgi:hypothetical protein